MSGPRAAIARLSLALRVLLYAAFLVVIGYFGFSYGSGYIAVPGDVAFNVPFGGPEAGAVMIAPGPGCLPPPLPLPANKSGDPPDILFNCQILPPDIQTFTGPRPDGIFFQLNENGVSANLKRTGSGDTAKTHITITVDGKTTERDFTGANLPDDIAKTLPASMKSRIDELLARPPAPPMIYLRTGETPAPAQQPGSATPGTQAAPQAAITGRTRNLEYYRVTGPALFQQKLRGNVAVRAGLVGITIALVVLAMIQFERLLAHFQSAELFSERNSGLLRNIGLLLVVIALVQAVATLLPAILARALHPIILGALGPHLFLVFAGLGLCLIAQVMAEASRLEDDAAHTV